MNSLFATETKVANSSKGQIQPRRLPIGAFRKLLLMISSRRFGIQINKAMNLECLIPKGRTGRYLQREILSPLEASLDHLYATPPSHFMTQKVRDFVVRFIA